MTTYQMHQVYEFEYPPDSHRLRRPVRFRIGDRVSVGNGKIEAVGEVIETSPTGYKVRIVNTYGNRRGPSEVKKG